MDIQPKQVNCQKEEKIGQQKSLDDKIVKIELNMK